MAVLKAKDPLTGEWLDIAGTGSQGPSGGPIPVGGLLGETVVKTGPADMEVGWRQHPRIAFTLEVASFVSSATANAMTEAVAGTIDIDPARTYHFFAGWRCIQDPGAVSATAHAQVVCGTVNLPGYDEVVTHDTGLWGAWSQQWLKPGSLFTAVKASLSVRLTVGLSVASKTFYTPRLTIIEY